MRFKPMKSVWLLALIMLLPPGGSAVASPTCADAVTQLRGLEVSLLLAEYGQCSTQHLLTRPSPAPTASNTTCTPNEAAAANWWSENESAYRATAAQIYSCQQTADAESPCATIYPIPTYTCVSDNPNAPKGELQLHGCLPLTDRDGDGILDESEAKLIARFSPLLRFSVTRNGSNEGGSEVYRPMDPLDYIRNSDLVIHGTSTVVIPNSILRDRPDAVLKPPSPQQPSNILDAYTAGNCSNMVLRSQYAIQGQLASGVTNNPDIGTYDKGAEWSTIEKNGNVGIFAHVSPFTPDSAADLAFWDQRYHDDRQKVIPPSVYETTNECAVDKCYKVEY